MTAMEAGITIMSDQSKNSGRDLGQTQLGMEARQFVRIELKLALTFIKLAREKYSMGHVAGANLSHDNAKKAYRSALKYWRKFKLSDPVSSDHLEFGNLFSEVKQGLSALSESKGTKE
jgi:hypothetical protein